MPVAPARPPLKALTRATAVVSVLVGASLAGCSVPHRAIGCVSTCGDGVLELCEECDDGNATPGDGCDETCEREPLVRELSGDPAEVTIIGPEAGARIGASGRVSVADFDGDGIDDIAIGAPALAAGAGQAFLVLGSSTLGGTVDLALPSEAVRFDGSGPGDELGFRLLLARVDADATFDLLIAAPGADTANGSAAGAVVLLFGSEPVTAGMIVSASDPRLAIMTGPAAGTRLGEAIAVGDVLRDSVNDVFTSSVDASGVGTVYLFSAAVLLPGSVVDTNDPGTGASPPRGGDAGKAMAVGDVNGDATGDLLVGAPGGANGSGDLPGLVFTLFGAPTLPGGIVPDLDVVGLQDEDAFGGALLVGDLDGDGDGDLVASATGGDGPDNSRVDAGEVVLLEGGAGFPMTSLALASEPPGLVLYGISSLDRMGLDLAAGDLDNDGVSDLIMGAPDGDGLGGATPGMGEVYVLFGHPGLFRGADRDLAVDPPDLAIYGVAVDDAAGSSVATGDVNGDGLPDLIIGAPRADGAAGARIDSGAVYVVFGG